MKAFLRKNLSLFLAVIVFIVGVTASVIIGNTIAGEGTKASTKIIKTEIGGDTSDTKLPEWFDNSSETEDEDGEIITTDNSNNKNNSSSNSGNENGFMSGGNTGVTDDGVKTYNCRWDKIIDEEGFIFGINEPWFGANAQGAQFASGNFNGMSCRFDDSLVYADLFNLKALGFTSVNIWFVITDQGAVYDSKGYITALKDVYVTNIKKVLNWAKQLDLGLTITLNTHNDNYAKKQGKDVYNLSMQHITDSKSREAYTKNALIPVLNILKEYEPWIVSLVAYCEPDLDVYPNYSWGVSQKVMNGFISDVTKTCKTLMPNVPIGLASFEHSAYKYNDTGLDYVGLDVYNNLGYVPDVAEQNCTIPLTLTEFACIDQSISEDTRAGLMYNMYKEAVEKGYVAGWFWAYDIGYTDFVTPYTQSEFTVLAGVAYNLMLDNRYKCRGVDTETVIDTPVWLAFDPDKIKIYFMSSRQADTYTIERSKDGKNFEVIAKDIPSIDLDVYGNGICEYKDLTREYLVDYYYRVTAKGDNGTAVSKLSAPINYAMPLGAGPDNLVKDYSFESGTLSDQWVYVDSEYRLEKGDSFGAEGTDTALVFSQTNQEWKKAVIKLDVEPGKTYQGMVTEHSTNWAGEFQWFIETEQGKRDLYAYSNGSLYSTSGWTQYFSDKFTVPAGVNTIYLTIQSRTHDAKDSKGGVLTIFDNIYVHEVTK